MGGVHLETAQPGPLGVASGLIFIAVAIAAGVLWYRRPAFAVAALLVLEPIGWAHAAGSTQITLAKAALVGIVVALGVRRPSFAALVDVRTRPLVLGVAAIAVVTASTIVPATYAAPVVRETLKALEYLLTFAVAAVAIATDDDERVLQGGLLVATVVACASALSQFVTGAPSGMLIAGRVVPRIAGVLEGPNQLAGFLDLAIPVVLAGAFARDRLRSIAALVLAVAVATDVLTLSRAGLLGLVAGLAVAFAFRTGGLRGSARFGAGFGILTVLLASLVARLGVLGRFFSVGDVERENGLGTRVELWSAAIRLWKTDPSLGIGAGNFERLLPTVGLIGVRTHANSLYLQSLAEGGIALFAAVIWTIVAAIVLCIRAAPRSALALGVGAATFGFAMHQLFDDLTFFPKVGGVWWLLLGAATGRIYAADATDSRGAT